MHAAKAFTATAGLVRGGLGRSSLAAVAGPTMRAYSSSLAGCWRSRSGGAMVPLSGSLWPLTNGLAPTWLAPPHHGFTRTMAGFRGVSGARLATLRFLKHTALLPCV
jgi:hypothetical protein